VILLVAMVAAIALTLRRRSGRKFLDPAQQVVVKRKDRIRIVSMPSEKKE
ncbi:MAG: NADH-quinone oxidoreductase subunit J, partial [Nitrosomonadaceae bacterium]